MREAARAELDRARRVLEDYGARSKGTAAHTVALRSPVAGRVLRVIRESEGAVAAGEPIMEIGDTRGMEVRVEVLSSDAVKIRRGMPVLLERWGRDTPLEGRVRVVEPGGFTKVSSLGVEEQRVLVLVDITSPPASWEGLGDAYRLDAGFVVWEGRDVLQVPSASVFRHGSGWAVFRADRGRARMVPVQAGPTDGISTAILSGLTEGDRTLPPQMSHPGRHR